MSETSVKFGRHPKASPLMSEPYGSEHILTKHSEHSLAPGLDQSQRASHGLKPHRVPAALLLQYINGGQRAAEE